MSEPKLISPMLDNFIMGGPISSHDGVCCCPAMEKNTDGKYIVKIISVPSSASQLEAMLLSGAYPTKEAALCYFKDVADGVIEEIFYKDGGSQVYKYPDYTIVKYHTLDGNDDMYIGTPDIGIDVANK